MGPILSAAMGKTSVAINQSMTRPLSDLTEADAERFKRLALAKDTVEEIFPDGMANDELWADMAVTGKGLRKTIEANARFKLFVGRQLMLLKEWPTELFVERGYSNWDDFATRGVRAIFGISRSEAFAAVVVSSTFALYPIEVIERVGFQKLAVVAANIRRDLRRGVQENTQLYIEKSLQRAQKLTVAQLRRAAPRQVETSSDSTSESSITISLPRTLKERWERLLQESGLDATAALETMITDFETSLRQAKCRDEKILRVPSIVKKRAS
jgi:hypothetical protein